MTMDNGAGIHSRNSKGIAILIFLLIVSITVSQFILNFEEGWTIIGGVSVLIVSTVWMHHLIGLNIKRLTIPSVFWWSYIIMIFIPSFFIFFEQMDIARWIYILSIFTASLTVPVGIYIANKMFNFRKVEIKMFYSKPLETKINPSFVATLLVFQLIALLLTLMYFYEVKEIPLLYAIKNPGDYLTLINMREESFKLLSSHFTYLYFLLRQFGYPILISITLGLYLISRKRKFLLLFLIFFIVGIFYASATLIRGPAAVIFISLLLVWYLYKKGNVSFFRYFIIGILLIFMVPTAILYLHNPERSFNSIAEGIFERFIISPAKLQYYYFEIFHSNMDFLYGRSIGKLTFVLSPFLSNYEYFDLPNYVYNYIFPTSPIKSGTAPSPFLGDLYANFGIAGVITGSLIAGFIMQTIQIWIIRRKSKDVLLLTVQAICMYSFWELNRTSLQTVLLSYGGITVPFFFYVYKFIQQIVRLK